jgi:hypothetical protein
MNRIRVWLRRRAAQSILQARHRDLIGQWESWADAGVIADRLVVSPNQVLRDLVDRRFEEGSRAWRQQAELFQLLWEIGTLGGDPSFAAVTDGVRWRSHPSERPRYVER